MSMPWPVTVSGISTQVENSERRGGGPSATLLKGTATGGQPSAALVLTIFGREFSLGFGGKGANQAVAARLCGATVSMVARVGDDLFGPATIANFISRGIDASSVLVTPGVSSGVAPIFVESSGQNRIWVVKGAKIGR